MNNECAANVIYALGYINDRFEMRPRARARARNSHSSDAIIEIHWKINNLIIFIVDQCAIERKFVAR